jgi:hypothetical protein
MKKIMKTHSHVFFSLKTRESIQVMRSAKRVFLRRKDILFSNLKASGVLLSSIECR